MGSGEVDSCPDEDRSAIPAAVRSALPALMANARRDRRLVLMVDLSPLS
jgi:hypothetical protein